MISFDITRFFDWFVGIFKRTISKEERAIKALETLEANEKKELRMNKLALEYKKCPKCGKDLKDRPIPDIDVVGTIYYCKCGFEYRHWLMIG